MSQLWIGKGRSVTLWTQIDDYVDSYVTIHKTPSDASWFLRWKELINFHKITKKKREFEFIAYVITGNPEATILDCITRLFTYIPDLDNHMHITLTNPTNGNIQYTYTPPKTDTTTNRYAALTSDENSDSQAERDLEDILQSSTTDPDKHSTDNVFDSALDTATSTLKKLSDFTEPIDDTSALDDFDNKCKTLLDHYTTTFSATIDTICNDNERTIRHIHNEYFDTFCHKCDTYYYEQIERFEKQIEENLIKLDSDLNQNNCCEYTPAENS